MKHTHSSVMGCSNLLSGSLESIAAFSMAMCGIRASRVIYLVLLANVLHLPMSFYDTTPQGRVLNIMSADMADIDYVVPFTLRSMINVVLQAGASLTVIVASLHWVIVVLPPLIIVYFFVQVLISLHYHFALCLP